MRTMAGAPVAPAHAAGRACRVVSGVRMRPATRHFGVVRARAQQSPVEQAVSAFRGLGKAALAGVAAAALVRPSRAIAPRPRCASHAHTDAAPPPPPAQPWRPA
jgi:hypothetical protein